MKLGKDIKKQTFRDYKINYGTVNYKKLNSIYLNISSWCEPKTEYDELYIKQISRLNKEIRQFLFQLLSTSRFFNNKKTILDFDIKENGVKYGKRSFMNCEITLILNNEDSFKNEFVINEIDYVCDQLIENIFEKNKNFKFYKRKK